MMKKVLVAIALIGFVVAASVMYWYAGSQRRAVEVQRQVSAGKRVNFTGPPPLFCRCHSKNPKMRKMHRPFGLNDCALCHGSKDMMKRGGPKPSAAGLRRRIMTTPICLQCHKHW